MINDDKHIVFVCIFNGLYGLVYVSGLITIHYYSSGISKMFIVIIFASIVAFYTKGSVAPVDSLIVIKTPPPTRSCLFIGSIFFSLKPNAQQ